MPRPVNCTSPRSLTNVIAPTLPAELASSPARRASLALATLLHDIGDQLEPLHRLLQHTGSYFATHTILLLENDSTDCTAQRMQQLCRTHANTVCLNYVGLKNALHRFLAPNPEASKGRHGQRFAKMSLLRNMLLLHATRLVDHEYVAFIDGDLAAKGRQWLPGRLQMATLQSATAGAGASAAGASAAGASAGGAPALPSLRWGGSTRGWDAPAVLGAVDRALRMTSSWSGSCAYSTFGEARWHYDVLALRLANHTPIPALARRARPTWDAAGWNERLSPRTISDMHLAMFAFSVPGYGNGGSSPSPALLPVRSCFGGLAVYSLPRLRVSRCRYDERASQCEHIALNECLEAAFPHSIYVDTEARVYYDEMSHAADHPPAVLSRAYTVTSTAARPMRVGHSGTGTGVVGQQHPVRSITAPVVESQHLATGAAHNHRRPPERGFAAAPPERGFAAAPPERGSAAAGFTPSQPAGGAATAADDLPLARSLAEGWPLASPRVQTPAVKRALQSAEARAGAMIDTSSTSTAPTTRGGISVGAAGACDVDALLGVLMNESCMERASYAAGPDATAPLGEEEVRLDPQRQAFLGTIWPGLGRLCTSCMHTLPIFITHYPPLRERRAILESRCATVAPTHCDATTNPCRLPRTHVARLTSMVPACPPLASGFATCARPT